MAAQRPVEHGTTELEDSAVMGGFCQQGADVFELLVSGHSNVATGCLSS